MHQEARPLAPAVLTSLYRELGTCLAVAEHLGLPDPRRRGRYRVWRRLKQAGMTWKGEGWRKMGQAEERRRLNAIYESRSIAGAARLLGLRPGALNSWLKDRGWRVEPRLAVYGPEGELV